MMSFRALIDTHLVNFVVLMAEIIDQLDAALGEFHSVEEDLADTE